MERQNVKEKPIVSVVGCQTYDPDVVRQAVAGVLAPLGGMARFVQPGMKVLLKPNLLNDADLDRAVTTHPILVQAVAEQVRAAGGTVIVGDSSGGPIEENPRVWRKNGIAQVAETEGLNLVHFDQATWKRLNGIDYFIAPPVLEADLVIDLPKLKTHMLTLYTGAVKNLFGVIPGTRKRDLHLRAPGIADFSRILVDILELVRPGLTIMDGVLGLEGQGPGTGGKPHRYACLVASMDPVAVDAVLSSAMGFREGEVLHLGQANERGLGVSCPGAIRIEGERQVLSFGALDLPRPHWYFRVPSWASVPVQRLARVRPHVIASACIGCGRCVEVCPKEALTRGRPPALDTGRCIGCLCCAEVCPQAAIETRRNLVARLVGTGR